MSYGVFEKWTYVEEPDTWFIGSERDGCGVSCVGIPCVYEIVVVYRGNVYHLDDELELETAKKKAIEKWNSLKFED